MTSVSKLTRIAEGSETIFIRTGCIWYLPVNYSMQFPLVSLYEDNDGLYKQSDDKLWRNPKTGKYEPGWPEEEIVLTAKVRPFLVFQKPALLKTLSDLHVPTWYREAVVGFPITSLENLEQNPTTRVDLVRLKATNDYEFIHYISETGTSGLQKESCVILCTPININVHFFTTYIGHLGENDLSQIKEKIPKVIDVEIKKAIYDC
jgi:hypothetical protein